MHKPFILFVHLLSIVALVALAAIVDGQKPPLNTISKWINSLLPSATGWITTNSMYMHYIIIGLGLVSLIGGIYTWVVYPQSKLFAILSLLLSLGLIGLSAAYLLDKTKTAEGILSTGAMVGVGMYVLVFITAIFVRSTKRSIVAPSPVLNTMTSPLSSPLPSPMSSPLSSPMSSPRRRASPKRASPKMRASPKRGSPKKRKSPKRGSPKRGSPKRRSPRCYA